MRKYLVGLLILLAACRPDPEFAPSPLDRNDTAIALATINAVATLEAISTLEALPTQTLPPTRVIATIPPTLTPTPTNAYEYVLSSHAPGLWRTATLIDSTGTRRTLGDFAGQVVFIQTFSSFCQLCAEQTDEIKFAVERMNAFGNIQQAVFLILSVDASDTPSVLAEYDSSHIPQLADGQTWITGVASQELLRNLRDLFGASLIDPYRGGVLLVDRDGLIHQVADSFMDFRQIESVLPYFVNYDTLATEEAPEQGR
ncbi:MAG: SCO family protein [Anaerolineae bacterium]|nr:SCO family protein [Anaerolineae bacterium]